MYFDVVIIGDFRFPGGTSSAIASEVTALTDAGYSVGLVPVAGSVLKYPHPINEVISDLFTDGPATLIAPHQPVQARLCVLHHPQVFSAYPSQAWNISAEVYRLIVHHPPVDTSGEKYYDWAAIDQTVNDLFGAVQWAPVGPKVRAAFDSLDKQPVLASDDWLNVLDVNDFALERDGFIGARPVIGRHSRPEPQKWPDDKTIFLQAYPEAPDITVRLMGYGAAQKEMIGVPPANWELLPFNALPVARFLAGIDFFVYFHSDAWIEAFGRSILEAIAAGAVAILPRHFQPLFGDAALYCDAEDVARLVRDLHRNPIKYRRQSRRGKDIIREKFGPGQAVARVAALIGKPRKSRKAAEAKQPTKILYLTSNGVGMGHITRAMAVARRLPETVVPVIATMSKAFAVCRDDGIHSEYIPYHKSIGMEYMHWQLSLEKEMAELIAFHRPQVFVLDGNVPYRGLVSTLKRHPEIWKVWQRRGMWAPGTGGAHIAQEPVFDAVVEPGELAAAFDRGATRDSRSKSFLVNPIRYLRDEETLSRQNARKDLSLGRDDTAVLLQLGSEKNFDLSAVRRQVLAKLTAQDGLKIVNAEWLIRNGSTELPAGVESIRKFPISKYLAAFDFAVSSAGYNSFHENIHAGLPTIFVANENPEQDEQWLRAHYAQLKNLARSSRFHDAYALDGALLQMLDPMARKQMRQNCLAARVQNGAEQAAIYLANLAHIRR